VNTHDKFTISSIMAPTVNISANVATVNNLLQCAIIG
jgi:hypothetical protein